MENRRLEGRFLCADLVRLDWIIEGAVDAGDGRAGGPGLTKDAHGPGESGNLRSEPAILEDISPLGGCVQLEEPVPLGSVVMLTVGATPFYGHVCYCTFRDDGYFIGLRFSNDTTWSAGVVRPQHLTSLQQLGLAAGEQARLP